MKKFLAFWFIAILMPFCSYSEELKMSYNKSERTDNYYVQPGGVYVAPNGKMFIFFNDALVQVNALCTDEKGTFVPGIEMTRRFVWCPICEHWYNPDEPHQCR